MTDIQTLLVYDDIQAAHDYLVGTFGLGAGGLHRGPDGDVVHGEVTAGTTTIWLHRVSADHGLNSVKALGAATGMVVVYVDDVDAHHARTQATGARIDYPPADMPYGQREYGVYDLEGRLWNFATPLTPARPGHSDSPNT